MCFDEYLKHCYGHVRIHARSLSLGRSRPRICVETLQCGCLPAGNMSGGKHWFGYSPCRTETSTLCDGMESTWDVLWDSMDPDYNCENNVLNIRLDGRFTIMLQK